MKNKPFPFPRPRLIVTLLSKGLMGARAKPKRKFDSLNGLCGARRVKTESLGSLIYAREKVSLYMSVEIQ